jgi:hypothetical protein
MTIRLDAQSMITNEKKVVEIDKFPDACPICHRGIQPITLKVAVLGTENSVEVLFQCPRHRCAHVFIGRYRELYRPYSAALHLVDVVPFELQDTEFPETVRKVSNDFVEIAVQAAKADHMGLTLACGPAYRKALEFLIKDYVIPLHPSNEDEIKKMQLGACITRYVKNDRVLEMAKRAAWLGNDETHYLRKWIDNDLDDLKTLIALVVHWIEMEELTKGKIMEMPEAKKPKKS